MEHLFIRKRYFIDVLFAARKTRSV